MKLSKSLLVIPALSLVGAAAFAAGACGSSGGGGGLTWTANAGPASDAVLETDSCAALSDCCTADEAGDLYCGDVTTDCDTNFQYELNYGYCMGFTYPGFAPKIIADECGCPGADDFDDAGSDAFVDARDDGAREDAH